MKRWLLAGVLMTLAAAAFTQVKILPLGDSLTSGSYDSYRFYLWQSLRAAGQAVDFVGSKNFGQWLNPLFDADHEGAVGFQTHEIILGAPWEPERGKLSDWLPLYEVDITLLLLGTNDALHWRPVSHSVYWLEAIIDALRVKNPHMTILLATLPPLRPSENPNVLAINQEIPGIASRKTTESSRIAVVDLYNGFEPTTDLLDGVHPNTLGNQKIGARFYDKLLPFLRRNEDVNHDQAVNDFDIACVIFDFGAAPSGLNGDTDVNRDGIVDDFDLAQVIFAFEG